MNEHASSAWCKSLSFLEDVTRLSPTRLDTCRYSVRGRKRAHSRIRADIERHEVSSSWRVVGYARLPGLTRTAIPGAWSTR